MTIEKTKADIAEWLGEFAPDETVAKLLGFSVGRLLLREGLHWRLKAESHRLDVMHVSDWLRTAVAETAGWLAKLDEHGRPKKLMKFGTFREMRSEADRAMRIAIQKQGRVEIDPDHERLHMELADGYAMVEMLTPQALDRESSLMQHCIGNGGYDYDITGDKFLLLSLRDPFGKPHATLRVNREKASVVEFQGKQNEPPADRYMVYIKEFLRAAKLGLGRGGEQRLGMIQDVFGEWHDIQNLPDELETRGSLHLADAPVFRMPSRLVVNGDFAAPRWMDRHPDVFHVSGEYLSDNIPPITGDFKVGVMTITGGRNYKGRIPEKLDVGNLMVTAESGSRTFPEKFEVTGKLTITVTDARQVPASLKVGGALSLFRCTIKVWRGDVDCGDLDTSFAERIAFEGKVRVRGNLSAPHADVTFKRPLRISGDADFSNNGKGRAISELPARMFVGGDLILQNCEIGRMPKHLEVGKDLVLTDAKFDSLQGVKRVGGGLRMEGTEARELPAGLTRVGGLWAAMSKLEGLPDGFTTTSNLVVIGTPMTEFPSGMRIGGHLFCNDEIETLPDDAIVLGKVHNVRMPDHMIAVRQADKSRVRSLHRS
ncbi:PcfJ domain-containing protein [Rhizobium sp. BK176]|uniref:PcfJ domain-containing protein n=1 Tax=Rhizobium sp. BK176 TaxID=2587071 RepID=UPI002168406E|nr:PcfJ domain-containing protein [Rhizobium sp. BK176]MCS4089753.1 hypothetical protein [Rhizobium sp. BK176]